MEQLELLRNEVETLAEAHGIREEVYKCMISKAALDEDYDKCEQYYSNELRPSADKLKKAKTALAIAEKLHVKVGDGVTVHYYTDAEAFTVINRSPKTITIQRDNVKLSENFKPEFIPGGFAAHCVNQNEQEWTYSPNPNGQILICRWSDKYKCFRTKSKLRVTNGRHEFYDYNF